MNRSFSTSDQRRGLTLVELLVVIVILVMLVGVTIPLMRSVRDGTDVEGAWRKIEAIVATAKTRAFVTGRPAGIVFIRSDNPDPTNLNNDFSVAYQVALAESPPPYAGDVIDARALVGEIYTHPSTGQFLKRIHFDLNQVRPFANPLLDESSWFIRRGDTIRFSFRGPMYPIRYVNDVYEIAVDSEVPLSKDQLVSFQIFRAPRRSPSAPVDLPLGSFVVLNKVVPDDPSTPVMAAFELQNYASGVSSLDGTFLEPNEYKLLHWAGDVMVTFAPSGRIDKVHLGIPVDARLADVGIDASSEPVPRVIHRPLNPFRITLGNGNPAEPERMMAMLLNAGQRKPERIRLARPAENGSQASTGPTYTSSEGGD